MTELGIAGLWESLCEAGLPEVMLYLADGGAYRCHWEDTAMLGDARVALLGDQDRSIVRIVPVDTCVGIGIPSPKGVDPLGYRSVVREKVMKAGSLPARDEADDPLPWEPAQHLREP